MCKSMSGTPGNISCIIRMQDLTLPAFQPVNVRQRKSDIVFLARELLQRTHSYVLICCPFHCCGFLSLSLFFYPQSVSLHHSVRVSSCLFFYDMSLCIALWPCGKFCRTLLLEWMINPFIYVDCVSVFIKWSMWSKTTTAEKGEEEK